MWTVIVKLNGSSTNPTLFIIHGQIWHHTSNGALYVWCSIHILPRHSLLAECHTFPWYKQFYLGPKEKKLLALTVAWLVMLYSVMCKYLIAYLTQSKNILVRQIFKFIYIPIDNAAFTVPVFKKTSVTKYIFVGICYVDFHLSEMKNVENITNILFQSTRIVLLLLQSFSQFTN
jgi:hypothetical protein